MKKNKNIKKKSKNNKILLKWLITIISFIFCVALIIYTDDKESGYSFVLWLALVIFLWVDFENDCAHGGYA